MKKAAIFFLYDTNVNPQVKKHPLSIIAVRVNLYQSSHFLFINPHFLFFFDGKMSRARGHQYLSILFLKNFFKGQNVCCQKRDLVPDPMKRFLDLFGERIQGELQSIVKIKQLTRNYSTTE